MTLEEIRIVICEHLLKITELESKVEAINSLRQIIHHCSPFANEPVDYVEWVKSEVVQANDYNPNSVAPPEMELLRVSINNDGYTQPIVAWSHDGIKEVVDGFHRNRVGKEFQDIKERILGYLPVVSIKSECADRNDRIASTIRHNRARGKHRVEAMSDIVVELKRRNWSDEKVARELGMDPDEILRLTQITGLADMFADSEFSEAWIVSDIDAHTDADFASEIFVKETYDDEPIVRDDKSVLGATENEHHVASVWEDRTHTRSVLRQGTKVLAQLNLSPRNEWNWKAYTAPMQSGTTLTREEAKCQSEQALKLKS